MKYISLYVIAGALFILAITIFTLGYITTAYMTILAGFGCVWLGKRIEGKW